MLFGNRELRSLLARRRGTFQPKFQTLEERCLMAIDLGGATPPTLPNIATIPYGVDFGGNAGSQGAGFSVADVGDVTGSGFDDFLIGGPTVANTGPNGQIELSTGGDPAVYLVFGSNGVGVGNVRWLTLNSTQRVGDLGQLGNSAAGQQNPVTGNPGFPFNGIKFITSQNITSQLGASVAAVPAFLGGQFNNFIIGAPGATDINNVNPGTGRAYLVYGNAGLTALLNKTVDLDNPTGVAGLNIVTFVNSATAGQTGRSVAGVGDVFADGIPSIAIGAPNATVDGQVNTGAVYLVSGTALDAPRTATVNLATVGQTGGLAGVIFTGANTGDQAGFSVAGAGDFNGAITTANTRIDDLLIGAPNANGGNGAAYLLYGGNSLARVGTVTNGVNFANLSRVGSTATNGIPGVTFVGAGTAAQSGFAVAGAGNFGATGIDDILIGSPGFNATGEATLIYGQPVAVQLTGTIQLSTIVTTNVAVNFVGADNGDLAGYSLSEIGPTTLTNPNTGIAIGAPGFPGSASSNPNQGTVYLIPGNPFGLTGTFSLSQVASQPVAGTQILLSLNPGGGPTFFGASVSGALVTTRLTSDGDTQADFIVGAPGYGVIAGRGLAGGAQVLEGQFIAPFIQAPVNTAIQTQIGVGQPFGPFVVNATAPAALQIFVFSNINVTPNFAPVTQIDPTTVTINGVRFPNATITADPVDENKDGIPDAIITITPRANIGLTNATTTFTISGRTLATSNNPNKAWSGTAAITVTGGTGPTTPTSTFVTGPPIGEIKPTNAFYQYGPDVFVPPPNALSQYQYKPIPTTVAYQQFLPNRYFSARIENYYHPSAKNNRFISSDNRYGSDNAATLGSHVFTRSKIHPGKHLVFTHPVPVIPNTLQTERLK